MRIVVLLLSLFVLNACKKAENRSCFKFVGTTKSKEIGLDNFDKLILNPHVIYEIIQDSTNKVVITGGENLINFIETKVEDGTLEITNINKCHFLRNAKKLVKVEIHCTEIININFKGSEPFTSKGLLNFPYLTLHIRDGAGPVNLNIQSIVLDADISHGWGDYTLTGIAKYARISARSNGFCDTYGLTVTDSIFVASETAGNIKVNANGIPLHGYLKSVGDILYKGTPTNIDVLDTGVGSLLDDN